MKAIFLYAVLILSVVVVGCRQKDVPVVEDEVQAAALRLDQIRSHVRAVTSDTDAYTGLVTGLTMMLDLEEPDVQQQALQWLLEHALATEDPLVVHSFIMELLETDPSLAEVAVLQVEAQMMEQHPSAWLGFLQDYTMPTRFRAHGFSLWFRYYAADASVNDLIGALLLLQDPTLEGVTEGLFRNTLHMVLSQRDAEEIWALLRVLKPRLPQESPLYEIVLDIEGQAYLRDGEMDTALVHYHKHAAVLGDTRMMRAMTSLLRHAESDVDAAFTTQLREWAYAQEDLPMTRNRFARWDLNRLREEDVGTMIHGVHAVLERGVPLSVVSTSFLSGLMYAALPRADAAELADLRDLLLRLLDAHTELSDQIRGALESALLDVFFYLEDYARALARIEAGIPGYDDDWHDELRNKVKAHLAEQEGRIADAVQFYQNHIERVKTWRDPFVSPEDGRTILPDEVVALNERRIGDLWASAGETEKASAAYERAVRHYTLARDAYENDELSRAKMKEALAEMEAVAP